MPPAAEITAVHAHASCSTRRGAEHSYNGPTYHILAHYGTPRSTNTTARLALEAHGAPLLRGEPLLHLGQLRLLLLEQGVCARRLVRVRLRARVRVRVRVGVRVGVRVKVRVRAA